MKDRQQRQHLLRQLITEHDLRSQAEVVAALDHAGVQVHEATVSRDLRAIDAIKVVGADGTLVYRLAASPGPASARDHLDETLRRFVTRVIASGNLAVLR